MTFNVFIKLLHGAAIIQTPGPGVGALGHGGVLAGFVEGLSP